MAVFVRRQGRLQQDYEQVEKGSANIHFDRTESWWSLKGFAGFFVL